jgi:hypothetical protein
VIHVEKNKQLAREAAEEKALYDKLSRYKGPVSELIDQAAVDLYRSPKKKAGIVKKLTGDVRALLREEAEAKPEPMKSAAQVTKPGETGLDAVVSQGAP